MFVFEQVSEHERWWLAAWRAALARGETELTVTPEYGPPPYQPLQSNPSDQSMAGEIAGVPQTAQQMELWKTVNASKDRLQVLFENCVSDVQRNVKM